MSEIKISLHVGDTLRIEGPDGGVATYTVQQIEAYGGGGPGWITNTNLTGEVRLVLAQEEPRAGTWAQDTTEPPCIVRASPGAPVIEVRDPR